MASTLPGFSSKGRLLIPGIPSHVRRGFGFADDMLEVQPLPLTPLSSSWFHDLVMIGIEGVMLGWKVSDVGIEGEGSILGLLSCEFPLLTLLSCEFLQICCP